MAKRKGETVKAALTALALLAWSLSFASSPQEGTPSEPRGKGVAIECQSSGPFNVNSYLVYDKLSGEAALIDAGSAVDRLLAVSESAGLSLKYIFLTHGHQDHVAGLAAVRAKFPEARLCYSRQEFEDGRQYHDWRNLFDARSVASWEADPGIVALMDCDYGKIPAPDVDLRDGQVLQLGSLAVTALMTPGHSRGGMTFSADGTLFPGDLILYHATGYLNYPLCSREGIGASIGKLYAGFPNETVLRSGHGEPSTIGYEKAHNRNVTAAGANWSE